MSDYYKAAERSLTRNCSADWVAVTKFVDDTLGKSSKDSAVIQMKFNLLKARLSGPGGNTAGADGLTMKDAEKTSNVEAASILMDPLTFYQVVVQKLKEAGLTKQSVVLRLSSISSPFLQSTRDSKFHKCAIGIWIGCGEGDAICIRSVLDSYRRIKL